MRDIIHGGRGRGEVSRRDEGRDPFSAFRREMDRMFDDFLRGFGRAPALSGRGGMEIGVPDVDVVEEENRFKVTADLPGIDEKDIDVSFHDNMLSIRGEKRSEYKEEDSEKNRFYLMERAYGAFERTIPFDAEIDEDKIEADFKNGVLTVSLPKSPHQERKARKIALGKHEEKREGH